MTGSDHQTQIVLDCGVLKHFTQLLRHPRSNIQKVEDREIIVFVLTSLGQMVHEDLPEENACQE